MEKEKFVRVTPWIAFENGQCASLFSFGNSNYLIDVVSFPCRLTIATLRTLVFNEHGVMLVL